MADDLTADEIRALLRLEPNATCGSVRLTYLSALSIAPNGLPAPFADGRPLGSALYFMVTPRAPVRLHRIRNDQLYHYYLGDPIELFLLQANGSAECIVVGPDLRNGERVQQFIPGNTFHTARIIGRRRWFLGASTAWPGVVPADVDIGNLDELAGKYPAVAAELRAIAASVREASLLTATLLLPALHRALLDHGCVCYADVEHWRCENHASKSRRDSDCCCRTCYRAFHRLRRNGPLPA
jgi:uncharacterized protein